MSEHPKEIGQEVWILSWRCWGCGSILYAIAEARDSFHHHCPECGEYNKKICRISDDDMIWCEKVNVKRVAEYLWNDPEFWGGAKQAGVGDECPACRGESE